MDKMSTTLIGCVKLYHRMIAELPENGENQEEIKERLKSTIANLTAVYTKYYNLDF